MNNKYALELSVQEPWFSLIYIGAKNVEGRPAKQKYLDLNIGDKILFTNNGILNTQRKCVKTIVGLKQYKTFKDYLKSEKLSNALPSIPTIDMGIKVYKQWYDNKIEKEYGIVAIRLQ